MFSEELIKVRRIMYSLIAYWLFQISSCTLVIWAPLNASKWWFNEYLTVINGAWYNLSDSILVKPELFFMIFIIAEVYILRDKSLPSFAALNYLFMSLKMEHSNVYIQNINWTTLSLIKTNLPSKSLVSSIGWSMMVWTSVKSIIPWVSSLFYYLRTFLIWSGILSKSFFLFKYSSSSSKISLRDIFIL